ncbi:hypothetical protein [Emticicia sp. 17c]|uniref:hypothetical protein n=1 Tax=Emticicia sp. 17c TaxID=3127704 RepID=UPI00301C4058
MERFFLLITFFLLSVTSFAQFSGGSSVVLQAASGGTNYQWYKDGAAISGATSNTYTTSTPGTYYAAFNNGTCNTQTPQSVVVSSGTSVTLNASNTSGTSYQWNNATSGTATPIGGATSASYSTSTGGIYNVSIVTSSCTVQSNNYYLYVLGATSSCAAGTTPPSVN